jgi:hypothetical protein
MVMSEIKGRLCDICDKQETDSGQGMLLGGCRFAKWMRITLPHGIQHKHKNGIDVCSVNCLKKVVEKLEAHK